MKFSDINVAYRLLHQIQDLDFKLSQVAAGGFNVQIGSTYATELKPVVAESMRVHFECERRELIEKLEALGIENDLPKSEQVSED